MSFLESHPTRGAWIETAYELEEEWDREGRTPPGVRGLKLSPAAIVVRPQGRTPPGVRGLKLVISAVEDSTPHVAPHPGCVD